MGKFEDNERSKLAKIHGDSGATPQTDKRPYNDYNVQVYGAEIMQTTEGRENLSRSMGQITQSLQTLDENGSIRIEIYKGTALNAPNRQAIMTNPPVIILPESTFEATEMSTFRSSVGAKMSTGNSPDRDIDPLIFSHLAVVHEIGHIMHYQTAPDLFKAAQRSGDPDTPFYRKGADLTMEMYEILGTYSTKPEASEFVAEAFAYMHFKNLDPNRNLQEDILPADMINAYISFGGPIKVIPDRELQSWARQNGYKDDKINNIDALRQEIQERQRLSKPEHVARISGEIRNTNLYGGISLDSIRADETRHRRLTHDEVSALMSKSDPVSIRSLDKPQRARSNNISHTPRETQQETRTRTSSQSLSGPK